MPLRHSRLLIALLFVGLASAVGIRASQNQPATVVAGGDGYYHLATCINVKARVQTLRHIPVGDALRLNLSACRICEPNKDPLVAAELPAGPPPAVGRVTRIVDGDTLVLSDLGTVRLIGVDTPETVDPRKPVEEFGRASTAFLTGLALGQTVRIEYDQPHKDRFDRTLVYLYLSDGRLVNREVIRFGYGHLYTEFPFRLMEEFRVSSREAQQENRGLWAAGLGAADVKTVETGAPIRIVPAPTTSPAPAPTTPRPLISATPKQTPPPRAAAPAPPLAAATSSRCQATTQKGAQCKRTASAGSSYCWQHGRSH